MQPDLGVPFCPVLLLHQRRKLVEKVVECEWNLGVWALAWARVHVSECILASLWTRPPSLPFSKHSVRWCPSPSSKQCKTCLSTVDETQPEHKNASLSRGSAGNWHCQTKRDAAFVCVLTSVGDAFTLRKCFRVFGFHKRDISVSWAESINWLVGTN